MSKDDQHKQTAILQGQNQLLYAGIKYSAAGSISCALVLLFIVGPLVDFQMAVGWFVAVTAVYLVRVLDFRAFEKANDTNSNSLYWSRRFASLAVLASFAWASSMWIIFPVDDTPHQVMLIFALGGVCSGALATLPYNRKLNTGFQLIIAISVFVRLIAHGDGFSHELALFSIFGFGFLLSGGKEVGANYFELLRLKQDVQDKNSSVMKTTERMAQVGYWEWDGKSTTIELSDNLADIWGVEKGIMLIKSGIHRIHMNDRKAVKNSYMVLHAQDENDVAIEYRMQIGDDESSYRTMRQVIKRVSSDDNSTSLLGTVQDITDIKSAEEKIYTMAYYDSLTGLANRSYFHEYLSSVIEKTRLSNGMFSVVYIDLDNFKDVNDSYGHECGDIYLQIFAKHLKNSIRKTDLVARLGGDEFCILVNDIEDVSESVGTAQRCLEFTENIIEISNHRLNPQLSIGISTYPNDGVGSDDIVKSADLAMYHVKNNGKCDYAIYDERMAIETEEQVRLEADLKDALKNSEFELWYQPQVNIQNNTYSGVEALIRWHHPTRGMVSPNLFITTAERVGLIKEIGEWVLAAGCKQLAEWNAAGLYTQLAVNISCDHFEAPGFTDFVDRVVKANGLIADHVEIEITESMSRDPVAHTKICDELRAIGVRIAIDDFGTGYSSLSLLGKMPVDTLKIDKSFIDGLPNEEGSKLMVRSITELCLGFGYDIVAEGVEEADQLAFLKDLGIPHVQGYFFSKPLPCNEILPLLIDVNPLGKAA